MIRSAPVLSCVNHRRKHRLRFTGGDWTINTAWENCTTRRGRWEGGDPVLLCRGDQLPGVYRVKAEYFWPCERCTDWNLSLFPFLLLLMSFSPCRSLCSAPFVLCPPPLSPPPPLFSTSIQFSIFHLNTILCSTPSCILHFHTILYPPPPLYYSVFHLNTILYSSPLLYPPPPYHSLSSTLILFSTPTPPPQSFIVKLQYLSCIDWSVETKEYWRSGSCLRKGVFL